jgi:hypothetical protein
MLNRLTQQFQHGRHGQAPTSLTISFNIKLEETIQQVSKHQ